MSEGTLICLTEHGVVKTTHLTWEESLGRASREDEESGSWVETFEKALQIYLGKVKGLRGISGDSIQDHMKGKLKLGVKNRVNEVIAGWKKQVEQRRDAGTYTDSQIAQDLQTKF